MFFYVKTILNGVTYYSYAVGKVSIVNANPSIDTISYSDVNSTTTDFTNDDQIIIQNASRLQFQMFDIVAFVLYCLVKLSGSLVIFVQEPPSLVVRLNLNPFSVCPSG